MLIALSSIVLTSSASGLVPIVQLGSVSEYVVKGMTEAPEVPYDYSIQLAAVMEAIRETVGLR